MVPNNFEQENSLIFPGIPDVYYKHLKKNVILKCLLYVLNTYTFFFRGLMTI